MTAEHVPACRCVQGISNLQHAGTASTNTSQLQRPCQHMMMATHQATPRLKHACVQHGYTAPSCPLTPTGQNVTRPQPKYTTFNQVLLDCSLSVQRPRLILPARIQPYATAAARTTRLLRELMPCLHRTECADTHMVSEGVLAALLHCWVLATHICTSIDSSCSWSHRWHTSCSSAWPCTTFSCT